MSLMSGRTVLIADDEPNIRQLVTSMLGKSYNVLRARDGEEAVEIARTHRPDIILLDLMMPKKDGYSACAEIKQDKLTGNIPVIILTGVGYELNRRFAQAVGADGYVTKPFSVQDLLDVIDRLLK